MIRRHADEPARAGFPCPCNEDQIMISELNPQPLPPRSLERVRIYVDADVSYDLKRMNKVVANVLGKLGCGGCHSGRILEFLDMREFMVNPKTLEVEGRMGAQF